jgi:PAS domain S-box-containing protein
MGIAEPLTPECALLTSRESLARILHFANDAIIAIDERDRIILFNQGAEKVFGYAANEVSGRTLDILLSIPAGNRPVGDRQQRIGRCKDGTEFPADA